MAFENTKNKGKPNGYAGLGKDGKVPAGQVSGGGAPLMSERPLAAVSGQFTVTAGQASWQDAGLLTSIWTYKGDEYWGSEGTALALDMAVGEDGWVYYPEAANDHVFDVYTQFFLQGGGADAGKVVPVVVYGNDNTVQTIGVVDAAGQVQVEFTWTDHVFRGDAPDTYVRARVDVGALTAPVTTASVIHNFIQQ